MHQVPRSQNPSDSSPTPPTPSAARVDLSTFARPSAPPPRRRRLWTRLFVAAIACGSLALLAERAWQSWLPRREVTIVRPTPVTATATPAGGGLRVAEATGFVEPEPEPIAVVARRDGVYATVEKRSGDAVKAGEILATLDPADAKLESDAARELAAHASAAVAAAIREREVAAEAHALALELAAARRVAATDLAAAREVESNRIAAIAGAEHARDGAAIELERARELAAAGVSGPSAVELARIRLATAESEIAMRRAEAAEASALRTRAEIAAENAALAESHRFELAAALARAAVAEAQARSAHAAANARLVAAELALARSELRAPRDGIVARVSALPGARTAASDSSRPDEPAFVLFDPGQLRCRVDVPLARIGAVAIGQPAVVTPEGSQRTYRGEVIRITGEADIQKVALRVHVKLLESGSELIPERICRVEIRGHGDTSPTSTALRLAIPRAALRADDTVLVLDLAGRNAARRSVRLDATAARDADVVIVESGLDPSDKVILDADVAEGDTVTPRKEGESR